MKSLLPYFRYLKNKYIAVSLVAALWLLFFDRYSLIGQQKIKSQIRQFEKDKNYYQEECEGLRKRQAVLDTDPDEIEKYAREKFLMKRPGEDVFLVKDRRHSK